MSPEDFFGHIGYILLACGMWSLSQNNKWGWVFRILGEFIWVIIGVFMEMTSIWMWGLVFMGIDVRGFYKWWGGGEPL